jgi:hypothetical protein
MARLRSLLPGLTALILATLVTACGGGGGGEAPAPAGPGLAYTNPTGTSWRLVANPASTPSRLLLDLIGPADARGRGVGFNLQTDGSVRFGKFEDGTYVHSLGVFELGNASGAVDWSGNQVKDTYLLTGGIKADGKLLSVGCFQKDRRYSAKPLGHPLIQVVVEYDQALATQHAKGEAIPFRVVRARAIPDDIGGLSGWSVIDKYKIDEVAVQVGTLTFQ